MRWRIGCLILMVAGSALLSEAAHASTHEFFKGKTVRIVVGVSPGGAFDAYSRTIARHLWKHIPGNPTVIVENMVGAGGLISANYLYNVAKPDGHTIGNFNGGLLFGQILGRPGIEFDARKFEYIGVPAKLESVCAFTKASGITSVEKWMASRTPVKLGGTAPGSNLVDVPRILAAVLGFPIQMIMGYKGFADIRLAVEGGELAGVCGGWDGLKLAWSKQIASGDIVVALQTLPHPHPDFPQVPLAIQLAKTEEQRLLIQAGTHAPAVISLLYSLPPGTPKDRVQLLRQAFMDTLKTADFLADAEKSKLSIDPAGGEELEKIIDRLFKLSPALVSRLREILK